VPTPVLSVSLENMFITLALNKSTTLVPVFNPINASNKNVIWRSLNPGVATVDSNGKITAVGNGNTIISVTTEDGHRSAYTYITVGNLVNSISLNKASLKLKVSQSELLIAKITPTDAINKDIVWSSSNGKIAKVDQSGKVYAISSGTVSITCTSKDGNKSATAIVTVVTPVTSIQFKTNASTLKLGATTKLNFTINPANASNKSVTWTSSNLKVARVDQNGKVNTVGVGVAIITVKSNENGKSATIKITVKR
jgi:YD repeat-containing protein